MFGVAALRILPSANTLSNCFNQIRLNTNSINSLYLEYSVREHNFIPKIAVHSPEYIEFSTLNISNLSFRYPNTSVDIFKNLSLTIKKGQVLGIVGESGSGKSTLIDLILGFQTADSGQFILNGSHIDPSSIHWREKIAYIPQENFLIDATIKENIALGVDLDKIDPKQLEASINLSQLKAVLSNFDNGIDSLVGENGSLLSGGQRQRIAIARAIYQNRNFLILDESTSSIDKNTEMGIIKELNELKGCVTILIISHTPEILACCDNIFKLEDKKLTLLK
jgi:ABC-type multidrug transport system fused ATPase/permease subunit